MSKAPGTASEWAAAPKAVSEAGLEGSSRPYGSLRGRWMQGLNLPVVPEPSLLGMSPSREAKETLLNRHERETRTSCARGRTEFFFNSL